MFTEIARKNRILALRTVAARNAEPSQLDPALPLGISSRRGPRLELVAATVSNPWQPDDRYAA